jgi:GNAT superfamily N-acetyltransferase
MTTNAPDSAKRQAIVIRARTDRDVPGCAATLRLVHDRDGYPALWPADPDGWLAGASVAAAAWVAVADDSADDCAGDAVGDTAQTASSRPGPGETILGHVAVRVGSPDTVLTDLTGLPSDQIGLIARLFVHPEARGRAVGAALMAAAVDYARGAGLRPTLEVADTDIAARRLYDRLGWTSLGSRAARWFDAAGGHPLVFVYTLPPLRQP